MRERLNPYPLKPPSPQLAKERMTKEASEHLTRILAAERRRFPHKLVTRELVLSHAVAELGKKFGVK
jgi:hypothetical protein